jgi:hypothetical protein
MFTDHRAKSMAVIHSIRVRPPLTAYIVKHFLINFFCVIIKSCYFSYFIEYLRYILNILPQCQTIEDYEKLLPYKIDKSLLVANVA